MPPCSGSAEGILPPPSTFLLTLLDPERVRYLRLTDNYAQVTQSRQCRVALVSLHRAFLATLASAADQSRARPGVPRLLLSRPYEGRGPLVADLSRRLM